jgi:hypothetical protein
MTGPTAWHLGDQSGYIECHNMPHAIQLFLCLMIALDLALVEFIWLWQCNLIGGLWPRSKAMFFGDFGGVICKMFATAAT